MDGVLKWVSTTAVHIALIIGVTLYTIFGAVIMQKLESPDRIKTHERRDLRREERDAFTRVYLGSEIAASDPKVHDCLGRVLGQIMKRTGCDEHELEHLSIAGIDSCYQNAKISTELEQSMKPSKAKVLKHSPTIEEEVAVEQEKWSFGNALIFAFTVITTIGYGHVAPETFYGRLFCIIYGLIGVPITLLTIADLGMFLSIVLRRLTQIVAASALWCRIRIYKGPKQSEKDNMLNAARDVRKPKKAEEDESEKKEPRKTGEAITLALTFSIYLTLGAHVLAAYEPEMDFFKAFYFNFVTLTTIGLGDFVPRSFDYLFITLCYIGIGLALTTMAIELAADLLRKLHYIGRKMDNMANVVVWFGGKKMTMKRLVKNLGDQFNIPEEELAKFDLDQFVESAIKVEAGEIKTLRKPMPPVVFRDDGVLSYSKLRKSSESDIRYVDERFSKNRDPLVLNEDSSRTLETLSMRCGFISHIPHLDLDHPFLPESSLPTSFDDEYMKTATKEEF